MNAHVPKRSPYLTKSRFILALGCPTKLFYTGKPEYADTKITDEFLRALAEGGYQVGELAKLYFPGGIEIEDMDPDAASEKTQLLMLRDNVIIYEAAFLIDGLLVRSDIVVKSGDTLQLFEVKAKSIDGLNEEFIGARGGILSKWRTYLYDVAFQKHVIQKCYPRLTVIPYLLLADKTAVATVEGLNQNFVIYKDENRTRVKVKPNVLFGDKVLIQRNVEAECDIILGNQDTNEFNSFEDRVDDYKNTYLNNLFILGQLHDACGKCEFVATREQRAAGLQSGLHQCLKKVTGLSGDSLEKPTIFSLWDNRKKADQITNGKYFLTDLDQVDIESKSKQKAPFVPYLTKLDRQLLQINKIKNSDNSAYFDIDGFKTEMNKFHYPLNFIDFETTTVALPFNKGLHPYEQIAFQFSHHSLTKEGIVTHKSQWINTERGKFPNFDFVRALQRSLEDNEGTIFRYAAHENTILNKIRSQLLASNEADKIQLCNWIESITSSTSSSTGRWTGARNMVDMLELVKRYYYHPSMGGSNSIKAVLPAIINSSSYLKDKYSKPIYGSEIFSLNFKDQIWIEFDPSGNSVSPYQLLPAIHDGFINEDFDYFIVDEELGIADGGAAMVAYAKMQFIEMSDTERERIKDSLLRYCELDTLSMVMIMEEWLHQSN